MALITFATAEGGSLTSFLTNIRYNSVQAVVNNAIIPITGATGSGEADNLERLCKGFATIDFHWSGTVEVSGTQGLAESSTLQHGTVKMHTGSWSLARSWPMQDVTGSSSAGAADTEKRWYPGIGRIYGSASGHVIASGPLYDTASETLTIKDNLMSGTDGIAGTAFISTTRTDANYIRGGAIPVTMNYTYDQNYAHDASGNGSNFSAILGENVTAAPRTTSMSIDFDTGQTISAISAYMRLFSISTNFKRGGPIHVRGIYRNDHP